MEVPRPRVIVVDDDVAFSAALVESLAHIGFAAVAESDPARVLALVSDGTFDVALVDLVMPAVSGTDLAGKIALASPDTRVLILTGQPDLDSAIEGIHQGVFDYLRKDELRIEDLRPLLRHAADRAWLSRENRELMRRLSDSNGLLEALNDLATTLTTENDPQRLLVRVVESARTLCKAERARALLLEETGSSGYVVVEAVGDGASLLKGVRLGTGEGIAAQAVASGDVVSLTGAKDSAHYSARVDDLGASGPGFVCAPLHRGLALGVLCVAGAHSGELFSPGGRMALQRLASHAAMAIDGALQRERTLNFFTHTCDLLVTLLDGMDVHYAGHSRRVATLADMITRRLGLGDDDRRHIHFGALLHDIGKMRVSLDVLSTKTTLSDRQRQAVREHPRLGVEILRPISLWQEVLSIVHYHHERWDGAGYPFGIAGEDIPLGARVVAVAEVFEAMLRGVPHPPGRTPEQALAEIEAKAGTQFDPRIARLFVGEFRLQGEDALRDNPS
jgi:putative nucleotidyltransferase with HDIG domain